MRESTRHPLVLSSFSPVAGNASPAMHRRAQWRRRQAYHYGPLIPILTPLIDIDRWVPAPLNPLFVKITEGLNPSPTDRAGPLARAPVMSAMRHSDTSQTYL